MEENPGIDVDGMRLVAGKEISKVHKALMVERKHSVCVMRAIAIGLMSL